MPPTATGGSGVGHTGDWLSLHNLEGLNSLGPRSDDHLLGCSLATSRIIYDRGLALMMTERGWPTDTTAD